MPNRNTAFKLEMCQYDIDTPARGHPQPHAGILQKNEVEKRDKSIFFQNNIGKKTFFEGEKGP